MKRKAARGQSWRYEVEVEYQNSSSQMMGRRTWLAFRHLLADLVLDPEVAVIATRFLAPSVTVVGARLVMPKVYPTTGEVKGTDEG
jgi:hypothetical protein